MILDGLGCFNGPCSGNPFHLNVLFQTSASPVLFKNGDRSSRPQIHVTVIFTLKIVYSHAIFH